MSNPRDSKQLGRLRVTQNGFEDVHDAARVFRGQRGVTHHHRADAGAGIPVEVTQRPRIAAHVTDQPFFERLEQALILVFFSVLKLRLEHRLQGLWLEDRRTAEAATVHHGR